MDPFPGVMQTRGIRASGAATLTAASAEQIAAQRRTPTSGMQKTCSGGLWALRALVLALARYAAAIVRHRLQHGIARWKLYAHILLC